MISSCTVSNAFNQHTVTLSTDMHTKELIIAPKPDGYGSSVNGAEFLLLAIATCFCNDIYREAKKRNISVDGVKVTATCLFGAAGEPGSSFEYKAEVISTASATGVQELIEYVNEIAEIHSTLRKGTEVKLVR